MEDENDILIEDDILKAKFFNDGINGNTTVLADEATFYGKRYLNKINFKIKTGAWDTHEVC